MLFRSGQAPANAEEGVTAVQWLIALLEGLIVKEEEMASANQSQSDHELELDWVREYRLSRARRLQEGLLNMHEILQSWHAEM